MFQYFFLQGEDDSESTNSRFVLRGNKILICHTITNAVDLDDDRLVKHNFFWCDLDERFEGRDIILPHHLFQSNWTRSEIDFFDFDESHVVINYKQRNWFMVVCFKTGAKLATCTYSNFIKLNELLGGLLLTNFGWLLK